MVRLAGPADAEAIAELLSHAFAGFKPRYTAEGYRATVVRATALRARLAEGPTWVIDRERIIGTISARRDASGVYIRTMAVHPDARGQGLGKRLLRVAEQWAVAQGAERVYLSTTPFLDAAIHLYESSGFVNDPDGPTDWFGTPLRNFQKTLAVPEA